MTTLRSKIIRLAHQKPELRPHLLPLLTDRTAGCEKLPEGGMRDNCEKKQEEGDKDKKTAASAKAIVRYRKLEDHLKAKGDKEGLELLNDFADAMGI